MPKLIAYISLMNRSNIQPIILIYVNVFVVFASVGHCQDRFFPIRT